MKTVKTAEKQNILYRAGFKITAILAAVFIFFASPFFSVKTFNVTDMESLSEAEILNKTGFSSGMNVFMALDRKAEKALLEIPYVRDANIGISLPGTVNIEITERKVRGYVPYMGSYLYIDDEGRVLDVRSYFTKSLPVVSGLSFSGFRLGEPLTAENAESFQVVLKMSQLMTKYELLDMVVKIDVNNLENIYVYANKAAVIFGDISDADEKMRTLAAVMEKLPADARGTLDLSDLDKQIIFKYLT